MKDGKYISHLLRRISWDDLDEKYLRNLVETARAEDIEGAGLKELPKIAADITTLSLTPKITARAKLATRVDAVVCGMRLVPMILEIYSDLSDGESCSFEPFVRDGDKVERGRAIGEISGSARVMLQAERVILNFLQRLSGVATCAAKFAEALGDSNTKLLDTRKTTPSLRVLEKYAFACGGGYNHRMGLFDRVMLKDNHLAAAHAVSGETLAEAVKIAKAKNPGYAVEVEVDKMSQIPPVVEAGADVVMFDNFPIGDLKGAVDLVGGRAWTEVSGGVTLDTLPDIGRSGADFASTAAAVHSSKWIDIGLDFDG